MVIREQSLVLPAGACVTLRIKANYPKAETKVSAGGLRFEKTFFPEDVAIAYSLQVVKTFAGTSYALTSLVENFNH